MQPAWQVSDLIFLTSVVPDSPVRMSEEGKVVSMTGFTQAGDYSLHQHWDSHAGRK